MLRYAADLNGKISDIEPQELAQKTKFFVDTEILPVLDELRAVMNAPTRSWYRRAIDTARVIPALAAGCFMMEPNAAIAKVLTTYAGQFFTELSARGDRSEALKRSGLYYLLRLQMHQSKS